MPYIKPTVRTKFNEEINELTERINTEGELNYVISTIIWILWDKDQSYATANGLLGVLDAVSKEFYRRKVTPYEDKKIQENGDLF